MSLSEHVVVERDGAIARILMNRPDKKHALTHEMYSAMALAVQEAEADASVRVIYISGTEGCFTAGNDMVDFLGNPPRDLEAPVFRLLVNLMNARKPLIASVSGPAVGIGTTMLLHCDFIYCDETARFQLPFASLGLCPEAGSSLLLPLVTGYHRAAEILMLGESFDAHTAERMGVVNSVQPADALQDYAMGRARQLAAQPAASIRLTKSLMKQALMRILPEFMVEEGQHFLARLSSPEAKEAISAFMQKRKPDFSRFD